MRREWRRMRFGNLDPRQIAPPWFFSPAEREISDSLEPAPDASESAVKFEKFGQRVSAEIAVTALLPQSAARALLRWRYGIYKLAPSTGRERGLTG
jgi:hypothetical protein